jgi:outer membrane protein, heavy metal efflux system
MNKKNITIILCAMIFKISAQNIDSTKLIIDINDAKSLLLKQNVEILSSFYEISNAKANEVQARLWENPNFVWNQDMYSMELNQYFNFKNQKLIQIEQMIPISGRRRKEINQSLVGIDIAEAEYANCIRELLYSFSLLFNELYSNFEILTLHNQTKIVYEEAILTAENQFKAGLISGNEVIRLKSEKLTLMNSLAETNMKIQNIQDQLRILLFLKPNITIIPIIKDNTVIEELTYSSVSEDVIKNRPDYQIRLAKLEYEKKTLELNKATILKDLKIGYQPHDKGSNYARPYQGLVVEIYIPLFNRNQGVIEISKNKIMIEEMNLLNKENEIINQIFTAYNNFKTIENTLKQYDSSFLFQLETMKNNANENYNSKQINILEYIDIQRVYLQTITDYITLNNTYLDAKTQLKYIIGKN